MKPAFSYYGGKQRIASRILPHIEAIPHTVYVEPFAGGATLLFAKERRNVSNNGHYREVINDTNDLVINFYRVAQEQKEALSTKIQATLYSQSDYQRAKIICQNPDGYTDLERAWAFYVNINQSFARQLNAGWGTGVKSQNSAASWANRVRNLEEKLDRIKDVHVSSEDALRCIERWDSPQTLFYLDPPYPNTNQGHYDGYSLTDWQRLCDCLDNIAGSYVLSNYPQDVQPKSHQQRVELQAICSASGKGKVGKSNHERGVTASTESLGDRKRTEVLWICDRSQPDIIAGLTNRVQWLETQVQAQGNKIKKLEKQKQLSIFNQEAV